MSRSMSSTSEGWNVVPEELSTQQCSTVSNSIHKQKGLTSAEMCYNSIEMEMPGILNGLGKFHHYSFTCEFSMTMGNKPLLTILNKDIVSLQHRIKR